MVRRGGYAPRGPKKTGTGTVTDPSNSSGPVLDLDALSPDRQKLARLLAAQLNRPTNDTEKTLWQIWSDVLGRSDFGIRQHYLELGGDSIQAIQIIARARRQGLHLETRHLFELGTIALIAPALETSCTRGAAASTLHPASLVLTPMQRWFLDQDFAEPSQWNQSFLLRMRRRVEPELLRDALRSVCARHEAFRIRVADTIARVDLSPDADAISFDVHAGTSTPVIDRVAATVNAALNLERGPLLAAAWFEPDTADADPLLLVVVHHFISDGISLRLLLDDLVEACERMSVGTQRPPDLAGVRAGVWAAALAARVTNMDVRPVFEYLERCATSSFVLPVDSPGAPNLERDAVTHAWVLPPADTARLIEAASTHWRSGLHELLLAAVVRPLARAAGSDTVYVDMEGHGRADLGLDVSDTIGWFTSLFPLALRVDTNATPGEAARDVRGQLAVVPMTGVACGALRYMHEDPAVRARANAIARPQVVFNYLGQFQLGTTHERWFEIALPSCGPLYGGGNHRPHLLQCVAAVVSGALQVYWIYSERVHRAATIAAWVASFESELARFAEPPSAHDRAFRPQDFPDAHLTQADLEALFENAP